MISYLPYVRSPPHVTSRVSSKTHCRYIFPYPSSKEGTENSLYFVGHIGVACIVGESDRLDESGEISRKN